MHGRLGKHDPHTYNQPTGCIVDVTPPLGGHVTREADEGGEWSGSWNASRQN